MRESSSVRKKPVIKAGEMADTQILNPVKYPPEVWPPNHPNFSEFRREQGVVEKINEKVNRSSPGSDRLYVGRNEDQVLRRMEAQGCTIRDQAHSASAARRTYRGLQIFVVDAETHLEVR